MAFLSQATEQRKERFERFVLPERTYQKSRHDIAKRRAAQLRAWGYTAEEIHADLLRINRDTFIPPLPMLRAESRGSSAGLLDALT
jgi:hypothetical protein